MFVYSISVRGANHNGLPAQYYGIAPDTGTAVVNAIEIAEREGRKEPTIDQMNCLGPVRFGMDILKDYDFLKKVRENQNDEICDNSDQ